MSPTASIVPIAIWTGIGIPLLKARFGSAVLPDDNQREPTARRLDGDFRLEFSVSDPNTDFVDLPYPAVQVEIPACLLLKAVTIAAVQLPGKGILCETALKERGFENTGIPKRVQIRGRRACAELERNAISSSIAVVGDMQGLMKVCNEVNDITQSSRAILWAAILENAQLVAYRAQYTAGSAITLQRAHGFAVRV